MHILSPAINLPPFLARHGYKEPLDAAKFDNLSDVVGDTFFNHCQNNAPFAFGFQSLMLATRNYKMDWTQVYDTDKIVTGADLSGETCPPLFVDIGGMHGLDTMRLLAKHPELPPHTKLVVQDLPEVVEAYHLGKNELDPYGGRISRMAYDFFTPQPLIGARAYFLHAVPHDWPDAECIKIFERVKAVMKRGYSKLLIYEIMIPARGASAFMTTLDLLMMSVVSGLERTEEQWTALLARIGLRIVSISRHPRASESVIEAELA